MGTNNSILNQQLSEQQLIIKTHKRLVECLEFRLLRIREDWAKKSEYEKNEIEIQEIRTNTQIDDLKMRIAEMEIFIRESFKELIEFYEQQETQIKN